MRNLLAKRKNLLLSVNITRKYSDVRGSYREHFMKGQICHSDNDFQF